MSTPLVELFVCFLVPLVVVSGVWFMVRWKDDR